MRLALLALLVLTTLLTLAVSSHAAAPSQVFIQSYRGRAGKQFHRAGCEDLYGVIKTISLDTALTTHEACTRCFAETPTAAVPADAPTDEKVTQLLEVSGMKANLEQVPLLIVSGASRPDAEGKQPDARVTAALSENFRAPLLIASVARHLKQKARAAAVDGAIATMKSPAVMKFTELEQEANKPESAKALPDFLKELTAKPPSTLRRGAIERVDEIYGLTELQLDILVALALAVPRAQVRRDPRNRFLAQEVEDKTAKVRDAARQAIRDQALGGLYFAYRTATDEELTKYVQALEGSPDMVSVAEALRGALRTAIEQAADRSGEKLLLDMPAAPSPAPSPE